MAELKKEDFDQKDKTGIAEAFNPKYGEPMAFGYTADIYKNENTVIKVFSKEFGKDLVFREATAMACVEAAGVKMAKILAVREEKGFWVTVSELINGKDMLGMLFGASISGNIEAAQDIIKTTAKLQAEINNKTAVGLPSYKEYAIEAVSENKNLTDECRDKTIEYIRELPEGRGIIHGDFHPQNVLITEKGEMYVIDWVEAGFAEPACDAARTYMNYLNMPPVPPLMNPVLRMAETYIETYCESTGLAKEDIEKWLPVHAAISYGKKADWYNEGIKKYLLG